MENKIQKIDKLEIDTLSYKIQDALRENPKKSERSAHLKKALILGNINKQHVRLIFKNAEGLIFDTEATVWALTENYVILKGARMIPIRSIIKVIL